MTNTLTLRMMDREAFGRRLKRARNKAELSRETVAERLGVTVGAVQHHESGRSIPDLDTLALYTRLYAVSADWIISGTGKGPGSQDESAEVVAILRELPEPRREDAIDILRTLRDRENAKRTKA